jgi:hypothetical protein
MQLMKTSEKNDFMIHTNVQVYEYLQPHYKWNLVSIAFCDRMLMVMVSNGCSDKEKLDLKEYLTKNMFYRHDETNVYYRLKSRNGEFVDPIVFDNENGNARVEMSKRFIGRSSMV